MKHILLIFLVMSISYSHSQSITWQKLYNGQFPNSSDNGRGVCETSNGNIYLTGFELSSLGIRCTVLKLKPNGDTVWSKYFSNDFNDIRGYFILSTNDGGCIICGDARQVFIMKLDSNGVLKKLNYYGKFGTIPTDIIKTNNKGFVIVGYQTSILPAPAYVLKIDSLGEIEWQKYFYAGNLKYFNSIAEKNNGSFIISGGKYECELCNGYPIILELNNQGDSLWEKTFNLFADFKKIYSSPNGYLIGGSILDSPYVYLNSFIMKTSLFGEINYKKNIKYSNREDLKDMKIINQNKYVITCDTDTLDRRSAGVYILDSLGNLIHRNIFYNSDNSLFFSILPLQSSDLVFSGTIETHTDQRRDIYAVRTDSNLFAKPLKINDNEINIPESFMLFQNYPNPFNPITKIKYKVSNFQKFIYQVKIYDLLGNTLKIYNLNLNESDEIIFNGKDFPSGIYFYSLILNGVTIQTKKMLLIK